MLSVHYNEKCGLRFFVIFSVLSRTCRHVAIYARISLKHFRIFLQDVIKFLYFLATLYPRMLDMEGVYPGHIFNVNKLAFR